MAVRLIPYGPDALMAEYASLAEVVAAAATVRAAELDGVDEIIPAARTLLVRFHGGEPSRLREVLTAPVQHPVVTGAAVQIPVRYDGPDLGDVAAAVGLSVDELIDVHSSTEYTAAFCGFTPGFAYLTGLPPRLHLPRRATPRTVVPALSVAIGGEFTGVYPTASPGGWHLLGIAQLAMFDLDRDRPVLISPGDRVRFLPVDA